MLLEVPSPRKSQGVKILNVFNHYLEQGGEAFAVEAISKSLSHVVDLERCDFSSADWVGANAPAFWEQAIWMFRNPASLNTICEHQRRFKANAWLIHNVFPVGSASIYLKAKQLGVPIIQYIHNFRPFSVNGHLWVDNQIATGGLSRNYWPEIRHGAWRSSRSKTAWLAFVLSLSHALGWWRNVKTWIAISDFMREKFISAGVRAEDIFTLRHFWKPRAHDREVSDGAHYLYLGRLTEAKGISVLLDAWQILEQESGKGAPRLLIAGEGPMRPAVIARCERMTRVKYLGQLGEDAKASALEAARAVIVPSIWWEPLGLVVYEAYDYSRPVLAAASGGLPEIVHHGETGLLHARGNAEELAQQVMQLEKEPEKQRTMGQRGRFWLEQNANEAKWQKEFVRIATYALERSE
jgi:glycosyltransferase involved in cell wall biosynthesis